MDAHVSNSCEFVSKHAYLNSIYFLIFAAMFYQDYINNMLLYQKYINKYIIVYIKVYKFIYYCLYTYLIL